MKLHRIAAITTATALMAGGMGLAGPAEAAVKKPGVVVDYAHHTVKTKPKTFYPYKDLYFSNVKWTSLGTSTGYATATQNVNTCEPSCADANYKRTKVKLKFTTVRLSDCKRVFSKVKVTEIKSKKTRTWSLPVFTKKGC